ncbi:MAG: outer membrane protein assembly factor BamB [Gammaproteobacteria bacterium]|nr:outer membrane protein assembly factor BamB [Gammaproteobacteria bacterium]
MNRKISTTGLIATDTWFRKLGGSVFSGLSHCRLAALIAFGALLLGGCATAEKTAPKPMALASGVPSSNQKIIWRQQLPFDEVSVQALGSPLVPDRFGSDGLLVPASDSIRILDLKRGKVLNGVSLATDASLDSTHVASVGVYEYSLYVASLDGDVVALSGKDGHVQWRQALSGEVLAPPAVSDNEIVYHTGDGRLVCLDRETGRSLWVFRETPPSLTLRGTGAPLIVGNRVLAGFADGHLISLDLATGAVVWDTVVGEPKGHSVLSRMTDIDAGLLVVGDLVYASAYQGRTVAVSLSSGRIVWSRDLATYTGMSIWDDHLYVTGPEGEVWAFDRNTGEILWRQEGLMYRKLSNPVAFKDGVYVIDFQGYVHLISSQDGHLAARMKVGSESKITPLLMRVADDLLVADAEGRLWLLTTGGGR